MGPEIDPKGMPEVARKVSASKENGSVPQVPEDKLMQCANNYQDNSFDMEALLDGQASVLDRSEDVEINITEDVEVNITECTNTSNVVKAEASSQDVTESSSSFGNSVSGIENGSMSSDAEVESQCCGGNALASVFDGYSEPFRMRKKKLTDHWRRFIRPLMWRCKWMELQIKKFQSQALKYDRELTEYDQRKQLEIEKFTSEGFNTKSFPFSSQTQRGRLMKRKRRKRVEETVDLASYVSHHNLFSYYENKRSGAGAASIDEDCVIPVDKTIDGNDEFRFNDGLSSFEFGCGDNTLEIILWKIEEAQLRVRKLKTQIDNVMSENPVKFSSINKLSLLAPCDELTSSDQNHASLENGNRMPVRTLYNPSQLGDLMPESAVSGHEDAAPLLDMIDSKDHPQFRGLWENTEDDILIDYRAAKEEQCNIQEVKSQFTDDPPAPIEEQNTVGPFLVPKVELPTEIPAPKVQSNGKSLRTPNSNNPNNKRKPGRKKAGTSKRSRRSFG